MKPVLVAIWALIPCESDHYTELTTRTTTVYSCQETFRELAGPFVAEGWVPPPVVKAKAEAPPKKKKKRKKKRRR